MANYSFGGQTAADFIKTGNGKRFGEAYRAYPSKIANVEEKEITAKSGDKYNVIKFTFESDVVNYGEYDDITLFTNSDYFGEQFGKLFTAVGLSNGATAEQLKEVKNADPKNLKGKYVGVAWVTQASKKPEYNKPQFSKPGYCIDTNTVDEYNERMQSLHDEWRAKYKNNKEDNTAPMNSDAPATPALVEDELPF